MKLRRFIKPDEFAAFARDLTSGEILDESGNQLVLTRDMGAVIDPSFDLDGSTDRCIPYLFSTEKVARDGHTVSVAGFDLTGYNANPVFLWAHDSGVPPIGRVNDITRANAVMRGVVEYCDADLSPFADMIFRMVKKRFLNATSISWLPVEWKFSQDRSRPGGIDFIKEDLLEISQVPVPAQATSLATARSAGIDTTPMFQWVEKMLDGGGKVILPRAELEVLRNAAKMPLPALRRTAADVVVTVPAVKRKFSRDLWQVGELASCLMTLDWIQDYAEWEAEYEGDGSDVPARLLEVVQLVGGILKDMTIEEVNELLGMEGDEIAVLTVEVIGQAAKTPAQRALLQLAAFARSANAHNARKFMVRSDKTLPPQHIARLQATIGDWLRAGAASVLVLDQGMTLEETTRESATPLRALIETRVRAGRVLNAANEKALRDACDLIDGVVSQVAAQTEESEAAPAILEVQDQGAKSRRVREAEAIALSQSSH